MYESMTWCIPEFSSMTGVGIAEYTSASVCTCLGLELREAVDVFLGLDEHTTTLYAHHLNLFPEGGLVQNLLLSGRLP